MLYPRANFSRQFVSPGAIMTIIAVGVGPFKITWYNLVVSDTPATVTRAQSYIISSDGVWADALPANDLIAAVFGTVFACFDKNCSSVANNVPYLLDCTAHGADNCYHRVPHIDSSHDNE